MATAKTIVITLPKNMTGTPMVLPSPSAATTAIASKQLTDILNGNFVSVIKEEYTDMDMDDNGTGKPPRKRQRLDHLTMEEKIMRRKLKNRVAAQTARDRKKMRMDQLEAQLTEMSEHINELTDLTAVLTEQNSELHDRNDSLEDMISKCVCGLNDSQVQESNNCIIETQRQNVFEGVVIPVSTPIVGSAVSYPQQRAVGVLAVLRIMVLSTLCQQWINATVLSLLKTALNNSSHINQSQKSSKKHASSRWWGPQQQSWNPIGT